MVHVVFVLVAYIQTMTSNFWVNMDLIRVERGRDSKVMCGDLGIMMKLG
jgi:hypothetical protein